MHSSMKIALVFSLVVAVLVGTIGAYAYVGRGPLVSTSSTGPSACSQPKGVLKVQLTPSAPFGSVTSYPLPTPLKAPNSITVAPDGSVWFGEIGLRGVGHLFTNGTLLEYSWPASAITPQTNCFDISELWGLALWNGMVWTSDAANNQLLGLIPANDTFVSVHMAPGTLPRFLAVDQDDNLWFTASSTDPTEIGVLSSLNFTARYFDVPAPAGQLSASIYFYNASLAFVVTVNPGDNAGDVFSFNPESGQPTFSAIGGASALLGPYSVAVADGGLWASEHDASDVVLYNESSSTWVRYPTSLNPEVALTLPYYLVGNGSSLWFNEQTGNRIAELTGNSLTEFNISAKPLFAAGIENALTLALDKNLVWFTEWTGNAVGYVNASISPGFTIAAAADSVTLTPGSSVGLNVTVSGNTSSKLSLMYSDSETHQGIPGNLTITSSTKSLDGVNESRSIGITISAKSTLTPGDYLVLATVTDGMTYQSVYINVDVT